MLIFILEATLRSLLMAAAVWGAIRLLRVQSFLAQKIAWVLVLAGVAVMPFVMHSPWLAFRQAIRIPVHSLAPRPSLSSAAQSITRAQTTDKSEPEVVATHAWAASTKKAKPSAAHIAASEEVLVVNTSQPAEQISTETPTQRAIVTGIQINPSQAAIPATAESAPAKSSWNWSKLRAMAVSLYLTVAGLLLLRTLLGLVIAFRIWRSAKPAAHLAYYLEDAADVRITRSLKTPVTIGSTVILPAEYRSWDEEKLRIVLAHEASHVRQGDFYLQLASALYVSASWFSPLGWWLQRKLSELGEALSDRAGMEQAPSAASYAQILLDFAAMPRPTLPLAGVAMARSSHLSSRIDRILNGRFAFLDGRRHAVLAALLVPASLFAAVTLVRVVPAVEAAQASSTSSMQQDGTSSTKSTTQASGQMDSQVTSDVKTTVDAAAQEPASSDTAVAPMAPIAPIPPQTPSRPVVTAPEAPEPPPAPDVESPEPPQPPELPNAGHGFAYSYSDDGNDSFAIIHGKDSNVNLSGNAGKDLEKARQKYHNDFIWFEHDGKSYVITDPAILAQSEAMFRSNPELKLRQEKLQARQKELNRRMAELDSQNRPRTEAMARLQAQLGAKQSELGRQMAQFNRDMARMQLNSPEMKKEMAEFNSEIAKAQLDSPEMKKEMAQMSEEIAKAQLDSPEMKKEMAELSSKLAELQSDKFKKLTEDMSKKIDAEVLSDLQEKFGDIQSSIGDIQGSIGEQMGQFGEKQGELGERMGQLGEEMGRIGEQQGREAEEASRKVKSLIDKAYKEGKAKPVDPE